MYKALTSGQMAAVERTAEGRGISLASLMDAAGEALAREVAARVPEGDVAVVCGPGNNGGDGWAAARTLHASGRRVRVYSMRAPEELTGIAAGAARAAVEAGVRFNVPAPAPGPDAFRGAAVIVDALLGTGSVLPLRDPLPAWCAAINGSAAYVVSADIPTGCATDGGACAEGAVAADCTVTFATVKRGLVLFPGAAHAGEVVVADIGIPSDAWLGLPAPEVWTPEEYAALVRMPAPDAHKNSRGRVLVVAGSGRYPGAAVLAARGAMRSGAGYVTLATPQPVVAVAQTHLLAAPVIGLPAAGEALSLEAAEAVIGMAAAFDALVVGPGLTIADETAEAVRRIVAEVKCPMVLDADGLNAFAGRAGELTAREAPIVLTPHPGELGRLIGASADRVQVDRVSSSAELAGSARAVVLKGAGTVVSVAGRQVVNTSGTPALATAGTGDVLAGVIGTALAQGMAPLTAGAFGAYLHGRAGEAAASTLTPLCVTAEDVPDNLPVAMAELLGMW